MTQKFQLITVLEVVNLGKSQKLDVGNYRLLTFVAYFLLSTRTMQHLCFLSHLHFCMTVLFALQSFFMTLPSEEAIERMRKVPPKETWVPPNGEVPDALRVRCVYRG